MNNLIQDQTEMNGKSFDSIEGADASDETTISMKDPDTILSMIVLLLSCLALAALAHVFV